MANEIEKEAASRASLQFIKDGQIVGLGTGSTAAYAVQFIGERVAAGLKIRGIPTSNNTRETATKLGIPLTNFDEVQHIDVTIDGADEFDPQLNLIKGGGAELFDFAADEREGESDDFDGNRKAAQHRDLFAGVRDDHKFL